MLGFCLSDEEGERKGQQREREGWGGRDKGGGERWRRGAARLVSGSCRRCGLDDLIGLVVSWDARGNLVHACPLSPQAAPSIYLLPRAPLCVCCLYFCYGCWCSSPRVYCSGMSWLSSILSLLSSVVLYFLPFVI